MMGKVKWLGVLALAGLVVPATLAQPEYENDFNSTAGVTVRAGVLPPYVYTDTITGDTGVVADTTYENNDPNQGWHTGYSTMDVDFGLSGDGPLDFSVGEFQISLIWDGASPPPGVVTFWVRIYSGNYVQDPNGNSSWVFSGGQNYAFEVTPNTGFNTFTRNVADFNETNWLGPFIPTQVYKVRYDSVVWDAPYHPYTFGIGYFAKFPPGAGSPVAQIQMNPQPPYACDCDNEVTLDGSTSFDTQDPNTGITGTIVRYLWREGTTVLQDSDDPMYSLVPRCGESRQISLTVYDDEDNASAAETVVVEAPPVADRFGYVEDFTSLAGIGTGGPATNLRLVGGTGPGVEADALSQGYAEINITPCYTVGAWHGTLSLELKVDGTQPDPFPDPVGFWLRAHSPGGSTGWFENIPSDGQWHAINRTWDSADYTDAGYDGDQMTFFEIQSVVWGENVSQTFGARNFEMTGSEPASTPPVANAGMDQLGLVNTSYLGMVVTLDGTGSTDDTGIVRYLWKQGNTTISDSASPTTNLTLGAGTYTYTLFVYDAEDQVDSDEVTIEITDNITPIASDDLAADFSMYMDDPYGRLSSETIPVTFDENTPFEIVSEAKINNAPSQPSHFCFDEAGNVYWTAWNGNIESWTKDLKFRWVSSQSTGHGDANWNTGPLVGERYVYAVGAETVNNLPVATAFAFSKATGQLVWKVPLLVDAGGAQDESVEPTDWRARKVLYNNRIFILGDVGTTGPSGNAQGGWLWVYVVNCGDGVNPGYLENAAYLNMRVFADGFGANNRHSGNLVYVPNAFPGIGYDGIAWSDWSGSDFFSDMFCVAVDPATAALVEGWGPDVAFDGPYNFRSHVKYSPRSNVIYTPSYNDGDLNSFLAWDPDGQDGQFDPFFAPPLLGAIRTDVGNHGHADVNLLDDFDANYTRVHCHGNFGSMVTYTMTNTDPFNFTIEPTVRFLGTGAQHLGLFGVSLWDSANSRTVGVTSIKNVVPTELVAFDLTVDPNTYTTDDGPIYFDNLVLKVNGVVVASEDFEGYAEGYLLENDPDWDLDNEGDPQHSPQIVTFNGSKALVMNPVSDTGVVPREGIKWWHGASVTISPGTRVTMEWDQWRQELSENIDIFHFDGANFGIFQWDTTNRGHAYTDEASWNQEVQLVAQTWQHILLDADNGTYRIAADGQHIAGQASTYSGTYTPTSFVLWAFGTEPTTNGQPYIQRWVDPAPNNPVTNQPWSYMDRGPVPGPDGTFYAVQFQSYDRRLLRIGVPQAPPPMGACCLGDVANTCVVTDQATCESSYGGTYQGDDVLCTPTNPCAPPTGCPGDYDCDNDIDFFDIDLLLAALGGESAWATKYQQKFGTAPPCNYLENCDADQNGSVDFFDIDAFLDLLGTDCP